MVNLGWLCCFYKSCVELEVKCKEVTERIGPEAMGRVLAFDVKTGSDISDKRDVVLRPKKLKCPEYESLLRIMSTWILSWDWLCSIDGGTKELRFVPRSFVTTYSALLQVLLSAVLVKHKS
ncbi:hypothetical protein Tco_0671186 [Tanacetum coccineum]